MIVAIAPISLEHVSILGDSIDKIAAEKAAIIKQGTKKVVVAPQPKEAQGVIDDRCKKFNIEPLKVEEYFKCNFVSRQLETQSFDIISPDRSYENLTLSLLGVHQMLNAASAIGIVESLISLGYEISNKSLYRGLKDVFWPARFEIICHDPLIVIDGAHNQASAKELVRTLKESFADKEITLVFGVLKDKDKEGMCCELNAIVQKVIITKVDHPRYDDLDQKDIQMLFPGKEVMEIDNIRQAIELAEKLKSKREMVLVTGSLILASEARLLISNRKRTSGVRLQF